MLNPLTQKTESFDVLIVGAGISGIGAAYHLTHQRPGTSFIILEALDGFGGTWLNHIYPGIRSDSDLYTYGYRFKQWTGPPIATSNTISSCRSRARNAPESLPSRNCSRSLRYEKRWLDSE